MMWGQCGKIWGTPFDGWRMEPAVDRDEYNFFRWEGGRETAQKVSIDSETLMLDVVNDATRFKVMAETGITRPAADQWSDDPAEEHLLWLVRLDDMIAGAARGHEAVLGMVATRPGHRGRGILHLDGVERPRRKAHATASWPAHDYATVTIVPQITAAARDAAGQIAAHISADVKEYGLPLERATLWHTGPHLVGRLYRRYGKTWQRVNDDRGPRIELRIGAYFGLTDVRTDEEAERALAILTDERQAREGRIA
jgi:hypothetical protein